MYTKFQIVQQMMQLTFCTVCLFRASHVTYSILTQWCRILFEKLTVTQLVKLRMKTLVIIAITANEDSVRNDPCKEPKENTKLWW